MAEYQIIDNFLEREDFIRIQSVMMGPDFAWYLQPTVTNFTGNSDNPSHILFTHALYHSGEPKSTNYPLLFPLFGRLDIKALIRIKANLYPKTEERLLHDMHRDNPWPHKGALFYVNTNDGATILEDGTEIASVENRMVLFDTSNPHRSTTCTDKRVRININFNYF